MKRIRLKIQGQGDKAKIKAVEVDSNNVEKPQGGGNIKTDPREQIRWTNRESDTPNCNFEVRFREFGEDDWGWPFEETPTAPDKGLLVSHLFGTDVLVTLKPGASPDWKYVVFVQGSDIEPLDPMIIIRGRSSKAKVALVVGLSLVTGLVIGLLWNSMN
jgi:hypothetical protein